MLYFILIPKSIDNIREIYYNICNKSTEPLQQCMPIRVDIFLENMFDFIKNLIFKKAGTKVVQLNTGSVKVHYNYEKQIDRLK